MLVFGQTFFLSASGSSTCKNAYVLPTSWINELYSSPTPVFTKMSWAPGEAVKPHLTLDIKFNLLWGKQALWICWIIDSHTSFYGNHRPGGFPGCTYSWKISIIFSLLSLDSWNLTPSCKHIKILEILRLSFSWSFSPSNLPPKVLWTAPASVLSREQQEMTQWPHSDQRRQAYDYSKVEGNKIP